MDIHLFSNHSTNCRIFLCILYSTIITCLWTIYSGKQLGIYYIFIYVGNLTSPYNGRWHMRNIKTNRFSMVMNDLLQLDCIGVSMAEMPVDFSFVDTTARQIVALAQVNTPQIIYHVLSPNKMPVKSLLECVKRKEIELVSDESFNEILQKQDMYETIGLTSVDREQQLAMIDTTLTLKIMNHISEKWPTITNNWLYHWAQYIKTIFNK